MIASADFLHRAEALKPRLLVTEKELPGSGIVLQRGGSECYDAGSHYTGYVTLDLESVGSHPDAPLHLLIRFFESKEEFGEDPSAYHGWISPSWIQEERVHLDTLPCVLPLRRRYAFRYINVTVLGVNYAVRVRRIQLRAVSSADEGRLLPYRGSEADEALDRAAVRTLHECMQDVFEDGPKRDRRLWLGDLRLQALTNYVTYRNNELVKRCLYLFAAFTFDDGRVPNNLFLLPAPEMDEQYFFDYSLFFINTLWDYYEATGDLDTLTELEPTARRQADLAQAAFGGNHLVDPALTGPVFVDWKSGLDKQASAQGIYLYALRALVRIEEALGRDASALRLEIRRKSAAAMEHLYDREKGLFLSGPDKQVSWASQIWMIRAGVVEGEPAAALLSRLEQTRDTVGIATPYLYHEYIAALIQCGGKQKAHDAMQAFWGAMLRRGADTFYEVFDPADPDASPYGGKIIHSYCHAWSCTPAFFLRTTFSGDPRTC